MLGAIFLQVGKLFAVDGSSALPETHINSPGIQEYCGIKKHLIHYLPLGVTINAIFRKMWPFNSVYFDSLQKHVAC